MTTGDFISNIESMWSRKVPAESLLAYEELLDGFDDWRLQELLNRVLSDNTYFPKPKDIWVAAKELGFFKSADKRSRTTSIHTWQPSNCKLCSGDGRLTVFMAVLYETDEVGQRHQKLKLRRIFRASDYPAIADYQPELEEHDFLFRCSCPAGDADSLPRNWPKWKGGSGSYQPVGREHEPVSRGSLAAVQDMAEKARQQKPRSRWDDEGVPF